MRNNLPGYDSWIMLIVLGVLLFAIFNFRNYSLLLKNFGRALWQVRERENAFDNHTLNETRILVSLILILCVSEGTLVMSLTSAENISPSIPSILSLLLFSLLAGVFYFFQYSSYTVVGYTFTDHNYTRQWLRCFNATQALLGLLFIIPTFIVLFNPEFTLPTAAICFVLYIGARIIFIIKGFRIFYHNLFSLIYFILYLCSLEIVPLVLVYRCRDYLSVI